MYRNRQKPFVFENEEEEFDNAMFNIGEEPLGKRSPNTLCSGGPLNSMLCRAWGGGGGGMGSTNGADTRSSPVFSPNSCITSSPKVNIGDCGLAFMDHRRWGGAERKMDKDEYEKRSAEVLMRLSNYKSPPQERNEENEWNAITSYVTSKPVEEVARLAAAAEDKKKNNNNNNSQSDRSRSTDSSSFRYRQASLKLSSGVITLEDEEDKRSEDLPHNARFNDDLLQGGEEGGEYFSNSSRGSRRAPSSVASSPRQPSSRSNVVYDEEGRGGGMLTDGISASGASFRDMSSPAKKETPRSIPEAKAMREKSVGREPSLSKVTFTNSASTPFTASKKQGGVSVDNSKQDVDTIVVPPSSTPKPDSEKETEESTSSPRAQKKDQRVVPIIPYEKAGSPRGRGGYRSRRSTVGASSTAQSVAPKTADPE